MPPPTTAEGSDSDLAIEDLQEYKYPDLRTNKSIRLLVLHPGGKRHKDIDCELIDHDLEQDGLKYEALSWAWGTESWAAHVQLRHQNRDYKLRVPPNLVLALHALRQREEYRTLWADAICINQNRTEEKSTQVPLMSEIYGRAHNVCIWLGVADNDSKLALDFIKDSVLDLHNFDDLCEEPTASPKWRAMLNLMQRPWFSRRWVVQEIALCHDATIYCGPDTITWRDFAGAVQLVVEAESARHSVSQALMRDSKSRHVPGQFEYVSSVGASLLVDASRNMFRNTTDHELQPLLGIEYLVSSLQAFEVTEPRDAIYALLALAKDTVPVFTDAGQGDPYRPRGTSEGAYNLIKAFAAIYFTPRPTFGVDYTQSYVDVCQQFVSFCIQKSDKTRALDIICRPWAPEPKPTLLTSNGQSEVESMPTWIPRLSEAAHSMFFYPGHLSRMSRKNADSLVGLPGIRRNYSAAGSRTLNAETLSFKKRKSHYSMCVSGFILDTVDITTVTSQNGYIPNEWLKLAGWSDLEEEPPQELWRTLIADRDKDGGPPPIYGARAFQLSVVKGVGNGFLNTSELIHASQSFVISEFFRRVQAVIWNRCLMKTRSGRLGIVRKAARPGDIICVLYGCSVPVILRRCVKTAEQLEEEQIEECSLIQKRLLRVVVWMQRTLREKISRRKKVAGLKEASNGFESSRTLPSPRVNSSDAEINEDASSPDITFAQNACRYLRKSEMTAASTVNGNSELPLPTAEIAERYLGFRGHNSYYEFLGECYVHGMMDGEAIRYQGENLIKTSHFEMR